MKIPIITNNLLLTQFEDAIEWLNRLGVRTNPGRLSAYRRIIADWVSFTEADGQGMKSSDQLMGPVANASLEIPALIDIHLAFSSFPAQDIKPLIDKLRRSVFGPLNAVDEDENTSSNRNFLFEALVTAKVQAPSRGIHALFSDKHDAGCLLDKRRIWIECKRLASHSALEENFKKACWQLEKGFEKDPGVRRKGLVAIDAGKVIVPGDSMLVMEREEQLEWAAKAHTLHFVRSHQPTWERILAARDRRIIGVLIRLSAVGTGRDRNRFIHISQWDLVARRGIKYSEHQLLKKFTEACSVDRGFTQA